MMREQRLKALRVQHPTTFDRQRPEEAFLSQGNDTKKRFKRQASDEEADNENLYPDYSSNSRAPNGSQPADRWLLDYLTGSGQLERAEQQEERPVLGSKCLCPPGEFFAFFSFIQFGPL